MQLVQAWIKHYGYFGVFGILLLENIGVPFPAETTLTVSGVEWHDGVFSLPLLILVASTGNIAGSTIAFWLGRYLGKWIVRHGKRLGITGERLAKTRRFLRKHGVPAVFAAKFIAGVRVVFPYLAGMDCVGFRRFFVANAIAAAVWSSVFIVLGDSIAILWKQYHQYVLIAGIVAVVLLVAYFVYRRVRGGDGGDEEQEEADEDEFLLGVCAEEGED